MARDRVPKLKVENILMKGRDTIAQGLKHERTFGVVSTETEH